MLITIYSIGKTKEKWLEEACQEYTKRLLPYTKTQSIWVQDDAQLIRATSQERQLICLDPAGLLFTSEKFSKLVFKKLEEGGSKLGFVIGGPLGLPTLLKTNYFLISLSSMTFTHQCTRLILFEQIYRAFEIDRGSPYHK